MAKIDEQELMEMLADAHTLNEGFEALVRQYSEQLYWKIRHIVIIHEDADDVLQNTWVKVWKSLGTFRGNSSLSTWLYRIAINESLDFLRHQKLVSEASVEAHQGLANRLMADSYFDGDYMQAMLQEAVASLPEVQRTVFTMKYYDDMKYSEISKVLQTSEGALKASYHLAVKKVTEYLHERD